MNTPDARSDFEKQYDTGMLPETELPKLIKILKEERESWKSNAIGWEKEYKRYVKYVLSVNGTGLVPKESEYLASSKKDNLNDYKLGNN